GRLLAAPVTDSSAALWDLNNENKAMTTVPGSADHRVRAVAFSPHGALASASSDPKFDIQLRDKTLQPVGWLPRYSESINAMALSPNPGSSDAMTIATGGADGTIAVSVRWDPARVPWDPAQIPWGPGQILFGAPLGFPG